METVAAAARAEPATVILPARNRKDYDGDPGKMRDSPPFLWAGASST